MARIAGVDIPRDKRVVISLTYIYGIGKPTAQEILKKVGINENTRVKDLTEDEIGTIRKEIESIKVEGDLRREVALNIKRLMKLEATEESVIVKDFLFVVKRLKQMLVLVRVRQNQSQERKNR